MIIRTSLLYILWVSTHIGALTAQTQITVTEGSTAELNCTFKNVQSQTPTIEWLCNDKLVFERKGKEFKVGDGYEGRVDVPEEKLSNGDCTLVLKNVSLNDEGEYENVLNFRHPKTSAIEKTFTEQVTLIVKEDPVPPKEPSVPPNNKGKGHEEMRESSNAGMKHPHLMIILLCVLISTTSFFCYREYSDL